MALNGVRSGKNSEEEGKDPAGTKAWRTSPRSSRSGSSATVAVYLTQGGGGSGVAKEEALRLLLKMIFLRIAFLVGVREMPYSYVFHSLTRVSEEMILSYRRAISPAKRTHSQQYTNTNQDTRWTSADCMARPNQIFDTHILLPHFRSFLRSLIMHRSKN